MSKALREALAELMVKYRTSGMSASRFVFEVDLALANQEAGSITAEPDGWKLVPSVPTEAMHVAAVRTVVRCNGDDDFPPRVWRAMLSAAPLYAGTPPTKGPEDVGSSGLGLTTKEEK